MVSKSDLKEHPLFKDRQRILAILAQTRPSHQKGIRLVLLNLVLAGLLFTTFLAGLWQSDSLAQTALLTLPGRKWLNLAGNILGTPLGTALAGKSPWIMARVGGITCYILLSASVILGLCTSLHLTDRLLHRASLVYLHRIISLSSLVFIIVHVTGLLLDKFINISLVESLVPFTTGYRPFWTGLGTLTLYGLIAVASSFYLISRLGYKLWRGIHYLSFVLFFTSMLHGLLAGSDSRSPWMQVIYLGTGFSVIFLAGLRFTLPTLRLRSKP